MEEEFGGTQSPDIRFGYNPRQFLSILETWGIDGCRQYQRIALLDLLYIPIYSITLSALLVRSCRRARWQQLIADSHNWIPHVCVTMFLSDLVETCFHLHACVVYPEHLPPTWMIAVGDLSNKVKWVSISISGLLIFTAGMIKGYLWPVLMTADIKQERRQAAATMTATATASKKGGSKKKNKKQ
eukprot:CAMPEP_0202471860 /NCGR_PEP_ID=MMETSP1360-20130828/85911_1 /ASSEMBLY_ACC=CAM_ASM_000848 /TAXON_ID=515479 /ORGANISM="Licmophora paradoxa, Strain CCMP2313" /LENGTH=184 /DNA_ID=CAMNT_0049098105 /DNA_START=158 /DNA_END=715 /DNA_ORIENTATION=+